MVTCDYCGEDSATCGGQLCVSSGCLEPMLCSERCQREACPEGGMCRSHPEFCEHDCERFDLAGSQRDEDERVYQQMRGEEIRTMNREWMK